MIQPSKLKIRTINYILASSHHDRMRGAMLFCPGVTFCSSKQSLELYESPIDKQHKYEQNLKRIMRQSLVDFGLSIVKPSDLFSCDQAFLRKLISICLSVRLSHLFDNVPQSHRIILKFSGVITIVSHDVHTKGQGQRSKIRVTEVMNPISRFQTVTPVWIHIWRWNDAESFMLLRKGTLLFFKAICQISRAHS